MNPTGHNSGNTGPDAASYDATLHVMTHAPVPDGLTLRVHAALRVAPKQARLLSWPGAEGGGGAAWLRSAAAAAIVFVVAGGGWGVFEHAQHQAAKLTVMPAPIAAPVAGGFSSAGAVRTPQTVTGPAVVQTPKPKHKLIKPAAPNAVK